MWLVGSKCYHANNTFFMHFVSSQIRDDRSQWVGVMCRTLWCHLSSLTYEFSIFKNLGGWQPWVTNNFSQADFMTDLGYKKKNWPGGLLILYCLPETINEPFFSLSILFHLLDLLRSSHVMREYFATVSVAL